MKYTVSIKSEYEFRKTLNSGKYASGRYITIYSKCIRDQKQNKLGICVSKKHGNSVIRNRLKRWAREAYLSVEDCLLLGMDIVILYKKGVKEAIESEDINYFKIKSEVENLVKRLGITNA